MRNLFLVLVLANLGFAAWHFWFADTSDPVRAAEPDTPTITLLEEVEDSDPAPASVRRCISIGPFADPALAEAAAATLRAVGLDPAITEPADADEAYWIDVTVDGPETPETRQLQATDANASESPAPESLLTQRPCESTAD